MTATQSAHRLLAAVATLLLLILSPSHSGTLLAQTSDTSADVPGLVGTWVFNVPLGVPPSHMTGFITYDHSGTSTTTISIMFGGPPQPPVAPPAFSSTDRGIWRQVPRGYEVSSFRMLFDPATGDIIGITRIRSLVHFDGDRDHVSSIFFVTQWVCTTPTTCPDPTADPPDVPEFAPPVNTWTASRVRFGQ